ncbi:MAG TPA: hypothetical protein VFM08_10660 [Nocardioides sp.]|nr:hypothetical protein [Nocardioides sp.]
MAKRVVLHIGTMKSGTSFVQSALMENPGPLEAAGARYLGETFGRQAKAVRDVYQHPRRTTRHRRWHALADEARAFPGDAALISMEFLSFAQPKQLGVLLDPFRGMEVEVVLTVRDQFRAIPAQWQTFTRNYGTDDWGTYLRRIEMTGRRARGSRAAMTFHRAQDVVSILERWSSRGDVRRVTVVTLPPPEAPREELWHRFCRATGVAAEGAVLGGLRDNISLGYASCDLLRRVNVYLEDVRPRFYRKAMRPLAREVLAPLREQESRPELDREAAELARRRNQEIRDAVRRHGHDLVGSLDDLPTPDQIEAPEQVLPPPGDQVLRAAEGVRTYVASLLESPEPGSRDDLQGGVATLDEEVAEVARLLRKAHRWSL